MLKSLTLALGATLTAAAPAYAQGALALGGSTADVARNGIAVGIANDQATQQLAEANALEQCRVFRGTNPAATSAHCIVLVSFTHEWAVVALDPKAHTPGFGWSVDADKATAERNAVKQCQASSPDDRKQFCAISGELQDTKP